MPALGRPSHRPQDVDFLGDGVLIPQKECGYIFFTSKRHQVSLQTRDYFLNIQRMFNKFMANVYYFKNYMSFKFLGPKQSYLWILSSHKYIEFPATFPLIIL